MPIIKHKTIMDYLKESFELVKQISEMAKDNKKMTESILGSAVVKKANEIVEKSK